MIIYPKNITKLFLTLALLLPAGVNALTPPIAYVSGDGSGDFNCDGISDQVQINQALNFVAANASYTTVYLKGNNVFEIDEPVLISSNTTLTGEATASIKLKDNAAWWTLDKPIIAQTGRLSWDPYGVPTEGINNVEIYGFTINGGSQLEPSGARYNTLLHFTFPFNIKIHDMKFIGGETDAIRLSSDGTASPIESEVYSNYVFASGHDAVSFVNVTGFGIYENEIIKTRTNSGIRATGCNNFTIHNNTIGNSLSNSPSGYAGIQIQNENLVCDSAEIYENIIYGKNGGIHVGTVSSNSATYPTGTMKNVRIHHNKIYKTNAVASGGGILLDGGIVVNGFQNTIIEHNVIDGGTTDGIIYKGTAGGEVGYQTIVRNNIIINNTGFAISNEEPAINTFIANNNLVYNNSAGNYNNLTSIDDVNSDPLFAQTHNSLNQWYHILASYDSSQEIAKIYIDGQLRISEKKSAFGSIGTNSYYAFLGSYIGAAYSLEGRVDEVALWNRALSTNEVSALYNNGMPQNITAPLTTDMQVYLQMENNWNDSSGNAYNALNSQASFTSDAINGSYAGLFNGIDDAVQYPNTLSTTNGISLSAWVYKTGSNQGIQTIFNKGSQSHNDHIWLYILNDSVFFELGNGSTRTEVEANIINPAELDYHVKSKFGRYDNGSWVLDSINSPCIDNGLISTDYSNEPSPNGARANIGVYGNTPQASKSQGETIFINGFE